MVDYSSYSFRNRLVDAFKPYKWGFIGFLILAKLNFVIASFDNVMALFVIVFAADLAVTYLMFKRVMSKISEQNKLITSTD